MRNLILTLVALCSIGPLKADLLTYAVTPSSGQFVYHFTLSNTGSTGGTLFDVFVSMPTDIANIDTGTIGTPVGWGDPTGGLVFFGPDQAPSTAFIEWTADFSGSYDVGIGNSLSGFSFSSSVNIGRPITFALNGSTDFATAQPVSSTPEPGFGLMILAISAIGFRLRYRLLHATNK